MYIREVDPRTLESQRRLQNIYVNVMLKLLRSGSYFGKKKYHVVVTFKN